MQTNIAALINPRCRKEAEHMFYHGYDNYLKHAFPEDELKPISCKPLTRDRANPGHIELNDPLGNYSVTLIDSLSTLAILASSSSDGKGPDKALRYFQKSVEALVEQYGDGSNSERGIGKRGKGFDLDSKVQVFETVIRGVGGLLSAHLFAVGELPIQGSMKSVAAAAEGQAEGKYNPQWPSGFVYNGQLLRLAYDLGRRLLPAFHTATGLPYPRVNLRHGVPFYVNSPFNHHAEDGQCLPSQNPSSEITETCSAGAGSLVLELTTLSRLTGDGRFEQVAKRAFWSVWERKSSIGLVGSGIDAETGLWTNGYTGIGAGIDSFYEYAAKASVLLSGSPVFSEQNSVVNGGTPTSIHASIIDDEHQSAEAFGRVWEESQASIKRHLLRGSNYVHPHYVQADLYTGASRAFWLDSLSAFYPGLLATMGHLEEATETHLLATALWTRYSALPERWSTSTGNVEGGLGWWGGRPEFIESTYHLYRASNDPWYLHVGEMVLRDIKRRCWTKCGWSGLQDVRSGERSDRMESFFLGETTKYLFLLFDPGHSLNHLDAPWVFSTEGHPLIIPRSTQQSTRIPKHHPKRLDRHKTPPVNFHESSCPVPPAMLPFTISAVAARPDIFHAANLARLHMMPTPDNVESPLIEFSADHPSVSISDVRSPSNYTFFPWTLPLHFVPFNAACAKITARHTFDISFPTTPNTVIGPGFLQRVGNGILINSMGGVRLGMIRDVPPSVGEESPQKSTRSELQHQYRVQAINNILLGKDESVFIAKDTASNVVSPLDPNFTRVQDSSMLDIVVDVAQSADAKQCQQPTKNLQLNNKSTSLTIATPMPEVEIDSASAVSPEVASNMKEAFSSLLQQMAGLVVAPALPSPTPKPHSSPRKYIAAIMPVGIGVAPVPDVHDALGPDVNGLPQGELLFHSIYLTGENCEDDPKLPNHVPRDNEIIVIKRGGCSFDEKLRKIPTFAQTKSSLKLVVVVSYQEELGFPSDYLIRPLLDATQKTPSGLPRHNPIPMVLVAGGEKTYDIFEKAVGVGLKRRYSVQAQGVPISNLIVL